MEVSQGLQAKLDRFAKLPASARFGLLGAIAALIVGGYWYVLYQDTQAKLDQMMAQEMELQRKLNEVRAIAENIQEFEAEIAALEVKLAEVLEQLPNEREIEVLLTDISNLGKTAGIEIKEFKRKPEVIHGFYAEVPIDLSITGEYHSLARFFDLLAGLPRIVNMGSVKVKVDSDRLEGTVLKVTGTATTFRFVGTGKSA